jgi:polyisoprenoid-binding protein YceI
MGDRYQIDPGRSRFTVQAFAGGVLSFFAHSPTFAVRDYAGTMDFEAGAIDGLRVAVTVATGGLELVDQVKAADRAEIETRMRGEVLEIATYPEIRYEAAVLAGERASAGQYRLRLGGPLALHGVTRDHQVVAELLIFDDGVRLRGQCPLRLSEFRIKPVTALAGAIKLKDELKVSFDLAALPEKP